MTSANVSWSHGYHVNTPYTLGYYAETSPARMALLGQLHGLLMPSQSFRYLELGCGQGYNLLLHAAVHPDSEFVGVDFMPSHVAHARWLISAAGIKNATVLEADFVELSRDRRVLGGEFHYAAAHGIASWISPGARASLYDLATASLHPGGVFYMSYNTLPGWLSMMPFQHMVRLLGEFNPLDDAIDRAKGFFADLAEAKSGLFDVLPTTKPRLERLKEQDNAYLHGEYNNQYWIPLWVSDVIQELSARKTTFLGSATVAEAFDGCLPAHLRDLLARSPSQRLKEQARDISLNQAFRRDLYVKGRFSPSANDVKAGLQSLRLVLNNQKKLPDEGTPFLLASGSLEVRGDHASYMRVLRAIEDGKESGLSIQELADALGQPWAETLQMTMLLLASGWIFPIYAAPKEVVESVQRLNAAVSKAAARGSPHRYLAASRARAAVAASEIEMLLLSEYGKEKNMDKRTAQLQQTLARLGRSVLVEGKPVTDEATLKRILGEQIASFDAKCAGQFKLLGVV
jgi:SAM-dependent methyltransferase